MAEDMGGFLEMSRQMLFNARDMEGCLVRPSGLLRKVIVFFSDYAATNVNTQMRASFLTVSL